MRPGNEACIDVLNVMIDVELLQRHAVEQSAMNGTKVEIDPRRRGEPELERRHVETRMMIIDREPWWIIGTV